MRIFVHGFVHTVGGAGPHAWATIRLWRSLGFDVAMLPWQKMTGNGWTARLDKIGVPTLPDASAAVVQKGDVVISFCTRKMFEHALEIRRRGAHLIWVGCMSYVHPYEAEFYAKHGPLDRVIVNSQFQETTIRPTLERFYQKQNIVRIPSCFWPDEWRFCPRQREGGRFYLGRLSRAATDKYSSSQFKIYEKIRKAVKGDCVHARIMAWDHNIEAKLGRPPSWCECLPAKAETAEAFLHTLHAMVYRNGGARENRPRVCFEAMACGTPVVAENEFGWPELIRHAETGFLADTHDDFRDFTAALALRDKFRLAIAEQARDALPELINAAAIGKQWCELFQGLQNGH